MKTKFLFALCLTLFPILMAACGGSEGPPRNVRTAVAATRAVQGVNVGTPPTVTIEELNLELDALEEDFTLEQPNVETYRVRGYPVVSFEAVAKAVGPVHQYRARFYDSANVEIYDTPLMAALTVLNFASNPSPGDWSPGQRSNVTFLLPEDDDLENVKTVKIVRIQE